MQSKARESWAAEKLVPDLGSFTSFTSSETFYDIRRAPPNLALRRSQSLDQIPVQGRKDEEISTGIFGIDEHDKHHRRTIFAVRSWINSLPDPEQLVGSEY